MEEKRKQLVIDEIEGQIIKPDEINMSSKGKGTLDQEHIYVNSVKKQILSEEVQDSNHTQRSNLYFRRMRTRL